MRQLKPIWQCTILALILTLTVPVHAEENGIIITPGRISGTISIAGYKITSLKVTAVDTHMEYTANTWILEPGGVDSLDYEVVVEADLDYHVAYEATVLSDGNIKAALPHAGPVSVPKYVVPEDAVNIDMVFEPAIISGTISTPNDPDSIIEDVSVRATGFNHELGQSFANSTSFYDLNVSGVPGADYTILVVPGISYNWNASTRIDGIGYSTNDSVTAPAAGEVLDKDWAIEDTTPPEFSTISGITMLQRLNVHYAKVTGKDTATPSQTDSTLVEDETNGFYVLDKVDDDEWALKADYAYRLPGDLSHLTGKLNTDYDTIVPAGTNRTDVDIIIDPGFVPGTMTLSGPKEDFLYAFVMSGSITDNANGNSLTDLATGRFLQATIPGEEWNIASSLSMKFDYDDDLFPKLESGIIASGFNQETRTVSAGETAEPIELAFETSILKFYFTVDGLGALSSPSITVKGGNNFSSSANGTGSVSATNVGLAMVTLLEPGEYEIEAFATVDSTRMSFGQINTYVGPGQIVVVGNTEGPSVQMTSPADMDVVCDESITVNGIATDDVAVASISINGTNVAFTSTNNANDPNEVSFSYTTDLPVIGDYTFDVVVTDEDQQEPATASLTITRDYCNTESPTLQVTNPANMDVVCADMTTISGVASDDIAVASITINGTSVAFTSTNNPADANEVAFSYQVDLPMAGENTFDIVVSDIDDQEPASQSLTLVRDDYCYTEGPTVQVTNPANLDVVCGESLTVQGIATDDVGVATVTIDGNSVDFTSTNNPNDANEVAFTFAIDLPLSGDNTFEVVVTDLDNKEPATSSLTVFRDDYCYTEGPAVQVTNPADMDVVCEDTLTVSGTATDDVGVSSVTINGTSVAFAFTNNPDDANEVAFSYQIDLPLVGENAIGVVVTDVDDKEPATLSLTVLRDDYCYTEPPTVQVTSPTKLNVRCDDAITINGIATDDIGVEAITINGTSVAFYSTNNLADANEVAFSYEANLPVFGDNVFDIVVTDLDNQGPISSSLTIVRDTCAPTVFEVPVDIKPTSCPNPLNVKSQGVLPVAILGTNELDVNTIDPSTIRIFGVPPIRTAYEDVSTPYYPVIGKHDMLDCNTLSGDGHMDLTLKFDRQNIVEAIKNYSAAELINDMVLVVPLTANLLEEFGGNEIQGEDVIVIKKKQDKGCKSKDCSKNKKHGACVIKKSGTCKTKKSSACVSKKSGTCKTKKSSACVSKKSGTCKTV